MLGVPLETPRSPAKRVEVGATKDPEQEEGRQSEG